MDTDEKTTSKTSQSSPKKPFNIWSYEPNKQEQAILNDCSRAFSARFIPASLLSATGILFGIQQGFLRSNSKLGPFPKLVVSTLLSYGACQLAVAGECKAALKTLRNSPLADYFREQERKREK